MKKFSLLLFFVAITFNLPAQSSLKKSVIIYENGDSVAGFIKDPGWTKTPSKFLFIPLNDSSAKKEITVDDAKIVIINKEEVFKKFTVSISMDEINFTRLHVGPDTSKSAKTVFLRVLVEGCNANLYSYTDEIKTRFFFSSPDILTPRELRYRTYLSNDQNRIITDNYFTKQLAYLANLYQPDLKQLQNRIEKTSYLQNELISIVTNINGKNNTVYCPVVINRTKTKFTFSIMTGFRRSTLNNMEYAKCHKLTPNSVKTASNKPYLGVGVRFSNYSRFSFQESLIFSLDNVTSGDKYEEPDNFFTDDFSYSISQKNFTLANSVNYSVFNSANCKIFLGTGFNLNYSVIGNSRYNVHSYGPYINTSSEIKPLLESSRIWFSFPLRTSVEIKNKISLNASYYLPVHQNNDVMIKSLEVGISYNFLTL